MKRHTEVVDTIGLIRSAGTTSAEVHDVVVTDKLLHSIEKTVRGDDGYFGVDKHDERTKLKVDWLIAMRCIKHAQPQSTNPWQKSNASKPVSVQKWSTAAFTSR